MNTINQSHAPSLDRNDLDVIILLLGFLRGATNRSLPIKPERYVELLGKLGVQNPERYSYTDEEFS